MPSFNRVILVLAQLLCWSIALAAQTNANVSSAATASISGQVRLNGEAWRGVTVVLRPERVSAATGQRSPHQVVSDANGNYRISGIVPGDYTLSVLDPEFVIVGELTTGLRGKLFHLNSGEKIANADLELKRGGVITGRVTDSTGQPLVRERIELTKLRADGQPQPSPFNYPALKMTDEHGVYRIVGLPEGRYLISIGTSPQPHTDRPLTNPSTHIKTYHPGVTDPAQARVVIVSAGLEIPDVDISVAKANRTHEIHGRVIAAETGTPVSGVEILYQPLGKDGRFGPGWRPSKGRSNAEGEFQITGLLPGKYVLYARATGTEEGISEPVVCEVSASTVKDLKLSFGRGASLSGVVVLEGIDDPTVIAKLMQNEIVWINKAQPFLIPRNSSTKLNADGSFQLNGIAAGKIQLSLVVNPALGGFWVKRLERNGVPQPDGIEVAANENLTNLKVVVGYANLTLRGEVKVIGGTLPSHRGIYVNARRLDKSGPGIIGATVDARGLFILENLLPGEYELRLVSMIYQPGEPRDTELSKLISGVRRKVTIGQAEQPPVVLVIDLSQKGIQ
ncbi:MAG TPA: carboxypeptidase-like regulatory domain-containing protein [Blastocatellia bacterium]|nr:carboxypeptidase-like regulatory domain-containing protein [Blastocatellia bacterium]